MCSVPSSPSLPRRLISRLGSRGVLLLALLGAGWPVLRWYWARLGNGADEPLGLLALAAALFLAPRAGWWEPLPPGRSRGVAVSLAVYAAAWPFAPPLLRAVPWVAAVAFCAAPRAAFAWGVLLGLSLPWVATVQFYLGYPLRCVTTVAAAALLRVGGVAAQAEGTVLRWAGERVLIDAPCSGIHMAWTLAALGAGVAAAGGADARHSLRLLRRCGLAVLVANTLRAAALFLVEMGLVPLHGGPGVHDGIGLTLFAGAALFALRRAAAAGPVGEVVR